MVHKRDQNLYNWDKKQWVINTRCGLILESGEANTRWVSVTCEACISGRDSSSRRLTESQAKVIGLSQDGIPDFTPAHYIPILEARHSGNDT